MKLHKDIREFIELCLSRKVEFHLVGGYAIGKTELIRNKQVTGRPQDLADVARLRGSN
jgi:hypothetical protein